jgi:hypothetical protein
MRLDVCLVVVASILLMSCVPATREAIGPEGRAYIKDLSKLCSFTPRNAGTLNEHKAGRWLVSKLKKANYSVVTQSFPVSAYYVDSLDFKIEGINREIPVAVALYAGSIAGRFEVTDRMEDCSNKILLISQDTVNLYDDSFSNLRPVLVVEYSSYQQTPFSSSCAGYSGGKDPETARLRTYIRCPTISVGCKDAMAIAGRIGKAKVYAAIRLKTRTESSYSFNVIAYHERFDRSKKYVCLCAHYDSVLGPAANDNGSGTILLLKLAEYFQGQDRNVIYAFTGSEEVGLLGVWWFVDRFLGYDRPRPYCAVNFTSLLEGEISMGYTGSEVVRAPGFLVNSYQAILQSMNLQSYFTPVNKLSDDFLFNLREIPAVALAGSFQEYYHSIYDYPRNYEYSNVGRIKKSAISFITNTLLAEVSGTQTQ